MVKIKKEYMSWNKFDIDSTKLIVQIKKSTEVFDGVFGIPRGGLILSVVLSHYLEVPLFRSVALVTKNTLVVDDISDTGETLEGWKKQKTATLYHKPNSKVKPDFFVNTTKNWVVFPWEKK